MSKILKVTIPDELSDWLAVQAKRAGMPTSRFVRQQLEKTKEQTAVHPLMRFSGIVKGPANLSQRKGYSRS